MLWQWQDYINCICIVHRIRKPRKTYFITIIILYIISFLYPYTPSHSHAFILRIGSPSSSYHHTSLDHFALRHHHINYSLLCCFLPFPPYHGFELFTWFSFLARTLFQLTYFHKWHWTCKTKKRKRCMYWHFPGFIFCFRLIEVTDAARKTACTFRWILFFPCIVFFVFVRLFFYDVLAFVLFVQVQYRLVRSFFPFRFMWRG